MKQISVHKLHLPTLCLALLAFSLPFELDRPLLQLGALAITNIELLLGLCIIAFLFDRSIHKLTVIPRSWLLLLTLFMIGGLLSAFFAGSLRINALKAILRTLLGIALMLIAATSLTTRRRLQFVLGGVIVGVLIASSLGLIELASGQSPAFLQLFRPNVSLAGPFMRLTGTFDYANQTAMALEVAILLCLGLLITTDRKHVFESRLQFVLFVSVCLLQTALILTFSRAALLTILALIILTALACIWQPSFRTYSLLLSISFGLPMLILLSTSNVLRLRLTTANEQIWYHVHITAPQTIQGDASQEFTTQISITNQSPRTWSDKGNFPISLGARIIDDKNRVVAEPRWKLGSPLHAGEQRQVAVQLELPRISGQYRIHWDLVEEKISWFEQATGESATTDLAVTGAVIALYGSQPPLAYTNPNAVTTTFLPPDLSRLALWKVAFKLWQSTPIFGVGLDNFRLTYGTQLNLTQWNDTLHSNNWYVETLVSFGLFGGLAFFAWQSLLLWDIATQLIAQPIDPLQLALACAILAFFIHGVLDYFLLFNATGLLFWLLAGCWLVIRNKGLDQMNHANYATQFVREDA